MLGSMDHVPWRTAMGEALYGPEGFFVRERPADHFRTSVAASPLYAAAVRRLAGQVDEALGRPDPFDLVDLGAGRGELLQALPDVPARWRLTAVELAPDPGVGLRWLSEVPAVHGLLFANEWLDDVPLDVVQDGRLVLVAPDGSEVPGPPSPYGDWCARWWPGGGRVEVGLSRDRAWARAAGQVRRGLAVAVDYGHVLGERRPTLTGYRGGRQVPPVPDGSCDITAHVALDSCAAATGARLLTQREALRSLGVDGTLPAYGPGYAAALQAASQAATLLDPAGLGGFGWLVQEVGLPALLGSRA
jgi:SAM-dependent MidA family methyltransferase